MVKIFINMGRYNNHRWVWEKNNGNIPLDENGQSYEIHHIDRNPKNNNIENLMCVSMEEHSKIHFDAGEYAAAYAILKRMKGISKNFSGWKHSTETKKKISESTSGQNNPMYGRKGYWNGKKQPKDMIEKRVQKTIGIPRPKQSETMKGRNLGEENPMYGIKGKDHPRSKSVIDLVTNKQYDSISEYCKDKNCSKQSFYYNLKKNKASYI